MGRTMKFWSRLINWKLVGGAPLLVLAIVLAAGCASRAKHDEKLSAVRLHLEVNPQMERKNMIATVLRSQPVKLTVAEEPFLSEVDLESAEIVTEDDTPALRLKFDDSGSRLLGNVTAVNLGKRIAVMALWPQPRWLAAPMISKRITNGVFTFTPDADIDECRRIVDGLNLVVKDRKKSSVFK